MGALRPFTLPKRGDGSRSSRVTRAASREDPERQAQTVHVEEVLVRVVLLLL